MRSFWFFRSGRFILVGLVAVSAVIVSGCTDSRGGNIPYKKAENCDFESCARPGGRSPRPGAIDPLQLHVRLAPARCPGRQCVADAFINSNLQRRYESTACARNFLQRQIAKTRADLETSERQLVSMLRLRASSTPATAIAAPTCRPMPTHRRAIPW